MVFSSAISSRNFQTKHIEDHVTVIGHDALTILRTAAQLNQLTRATALRAIGITSTGRGNLPKISTCLEASAMQINLSATEAIIFSPRQRDAAALNHLHVAVDFICAVHINTKTVNAVQIKTVIPRLFSFSVEASELETAPSICPFMVPSASIKCAAVEPVPTPTIVPGCTYCNAAQPTAFSVHLAS